MRHKDQEIPVWFNMNVHAYIIFLPVLEFSTLPKVETSVKQILKSVFAVGVLYGAYIEFLIVNYDTAPYPMYLGLTWMQRLLVNSFFLSVVVPVSCAFSCALKYCIHGLQARFRARTE